VHELLYGIIGKILGKIILLPPEPSFIRNYAKNNRNSQKLLDKSGTHEKPFLLNDVFKATISNVSSGSLPAGSAVLHEERVISEEYINTKQKRLWNT
jgi:hypothetical protein